MVGHVTYANSDQYYGGNTRRRDRLTQANLESPPKLIADRQWFDKHVHVNDVMTPDVQSVARRSNERRIKVE